MNGVDAIFGIIILIMSVVIHEVSHGLAANSLGDPTARFAGRLTLNPLKHLDPIGSVVVPIFTYLIGGFIFGWAKPVPYNPYNLGKGKWGQASVAAAGPVSNFLIAVIFGIILKIVTPLDAIPVAALSLLEAIVIINIVLGVFNLIPIPPLDGSKVLFALLPPSMRNVEEFLTRYQLILVAVLIFFAWRFILPIVYFLFGLLT
ncbi:MAG TPA: site-2 protease family protein [Candidatus Paceibacterota bacterium]